MKRNSEFHDYVVFDLLEGIPRITSRAMFSGYGIYKEGVIFAIIAEGQLYFKADETVKKEFEKEGSSPFTYEKKGGARVVMSYWLVPDEIMENREKFAEWFERAVTSSGRAKTRR